MTDLPTVAELRYADQLVHVIDADVDRAFADRSVISHATARMIAHGWRHVSRHVSRDVVSEFYRSGMIDDRLALRIEHAIKCADRESDIRMLQAWLTYVNLYGPRIASTTWWETVWSPTTP